MMALPPYTARNVLCKSGKLFLVKATYDDIPYIADNLRDEDKLELEMYDVAPYEAIYDSFIESEKTSYTLIDYNKPIAMMGVSPINEDIGKVWFLATKELNKHYLSFLKKCPEVIDILQGNFKVIFNFVPDTHKKTMRWLAWCGFVFDIERKYLHNQHEFLQFFRCNVDESMSYNTKSQPIYH
jgi:hypothetical protein